MAAAYTGVVPIRWDDSKAELVWLDNSQIPWKEEYISSKDPERLIKAIQGLEVRGAPILGEAGAYGIALIANNSPNSIDAILRNVSEEGSRLSSARPTAINLAWGAHLVWDVISKAAERGEAPSDIKQLAIGAAKRIQLENIAATHMIGENGESLIKDGDVLVTVCNAGTLACDGIGTSTAPMRVAWSRGRRFKVLVTYTAPLYQGARLTAWELHRDGIPVQVITDNMAGHLIREEKATAIWAGADRILGRPGSESGTVYNKIGTFGLALMAKAFRDCGTQVNMYVAAPTSTIDPATSVAGVRIEQRSPSEVESVLGAIRVVPDGVGVLNPAFDRTPPEMVSAIVTELGIASAPYDVSIPRLMSNGDSMVRQ